MLTIENIAYLFPALSQEIVDYSRPRIINRHINKQNIITNFKKQCRNNTVESILKQKYVEDFYSGSIQLLTNGK